MTKCSIDNCRNITQLSLATICG